MQNPVESGRNYGIANFEPVVRTGSKPHASDSTASAIILPLCPVNFSPIVRSLGMYSLVKSRYLQMKQISGWHDIAKPETTSQASFFHLQWFRSSAKFFSYLGSPHLK